MAKSASEQAPAAIRVGVLGVGVMGYNHARVLTDLPGAELVAIADPDEVQRNKAAGMLGCPAVGSLDELVALGVEAVVIAAPTHLHHDVAIAAINAGLHVLVEKPIAPTVAEGEAIVAAARARGVALMVGHVERFNPAVEAITKAIKGEEILSIGITRVGPFPPRMSNVGVVIDLAVHDIDLICHFTGSYITEVQPQVKAAVAEREDIALLQFRTANGVLAHINTNWLTPFKARTVHVATRNKYVIGDLLTRQVTECFDYRPDGSYSMRHLPVAYAEPLRVELTHFLQAIRGEKPPAVSGEDGVISIATAIRCLEGPEAAPAVAPTLVRAAG
ncbi:Gfo/Idh/MocA family oxidoreductase [Ancylobacter sp. G4_0304]|uniref:Gfo/Idh/MocA family oxidoreductase n=1 Tax=Ancylobacter sp. G4_0304 TaxID=3114289 RepID=UPI0039C5D516